MLPHRNNPRLKQSIIRKAEAAKAKQAFATSYRKTNANFRNPLTRKLKNISPEEQARLNNITQVVAVILILVVIMCLMIAFFVKST